ncbi:MAG: MBL fold metallo-hydrolase [Saprospiraceae bacterium]|nr:MBL fold metallo-hydrolase [Saprospiraceae bacterium]
MTEVQGFEWNPFAENTYVVYDDSGECVIFDPGCYTDAERQALRAFIEEKKLRVQRLINTHCHLDHVFGNGFVSRTWSVLPELHRSEMPVLQRYPQVCEYLYGISDFDPSPMPEQFLEAGTVLHFGNTRLEILFTPGHSPGSLSFYCRESGFVLSGDVLFFESIGRTDLPGGHTETLLHSIREELLVLPGETLVYPGHGPATTIRHEKEYNPFLG